MFILSVTDLWIVGATLLLTVDENKPNTYFFQLYHLGLIHMLKLYRIELN